MVITMDSKINKGRIEFNDENYEKALTYFDAVDEDDEDYDYVLIFKITCLMELEKYDKALFLIDSLLAEDGDDELLLYEKIRCHIALDENCEALDTLRKFERIIPKDNKNMMLDVARFYKILGEYKKALRLCNMALSVDEYFEDAIYEKALIGIALNNEEIVDKCADRLLEVSDNDRYRILPIFLIKMYCGKFEDCVDIIDDLEDKFDDETCEMLRRVVFNQLCEKLDVNIHLAEDVNLSVGQAIGILLDYERTGIKCGIVDDVSFMIM